MSEHTGWESEWDTPPAAPDLAGARREARAGQDAYRRGWEDGQAAARAGDQHPYRRSALTGAAAGYAFRVGALGALVRVLGVLAVVIGGGVIGLTISAAVFPQSTQLVMLAAMGAAVWWLVRRHRRRQGTGSPRRY